MSNNVNVSTGVGAVIAAEGIASGTGTVAYQQIKIIGGSVGDTTPVQAVTSLPPPGTPALVVAPLPGAEGFTSAVGEDT